jgi:predicted dehydrogenase
MATTLADCEAMVQVAKESGRYLMLGHNQRLAKAHVKAKELVAGGLLGEIVSFRSTFGHGGPETWSVDPGKNVLVLRQEPRCHGRDGRPGHHKTDLIHFLTGQLWSRPPPAW